ncbi:MAG: PPA1309 family protein, partial [Arachnia sp.]
DDAEAAVDFVMQHPEKIDVRVVVGVLRDGNQHGLARLVSNPDELLGATDLVPGLTEALNRTLEGATQ